METYVVRQPIFNTEHHVSGYVFLYNSGSDNESKIDSNEYAKAIKNFLIEMDFEKATVNSRAIIRLNDELLLEGYAELLPSEFAIIGIDGKLLKTEKVLNVVQELKKKNYSIAVILPKEPKGHLLNVVLPNIAIVNYKNLETFKRNNILNKAPLSVEFLAYNVDTREDYEEAINSGFSYFRGNFFSKPIVKKTSEISDLPASYVQMLSEINKEEPKFDILESIVEKDLGITYKVLRTANSIYYASRYKIESVKQALMRIGLKELKKWVYLMVLQSNKQIEKSELIKTCMIRGKFMELLAKEIRLEQKSSEFFLTGIFSSIDTILNRDMDEILEVLMLSEDVKKLLLGIKNILGEALELIVNYEIADWEAIENSKFIPDGNIYNITNLYLQSLSWADYLG